jgi:hypothetical protein
MSGYRIKMCGGILTLQESDVKRLAITAIVCLTVGILLGNAKHTPKPQQPGPVADSPDTICVCDIKNNEKQWFTVVSTMQDGRVHKIRKPEEREGRPHVVRFDIVWASGQHTILFTRPAD